MGNRQILVFAITFWLALLPLPFDTHAKEKRPPSSADSFWDAETEFLKAEKKYYCEGMVYINNGGHPNKKWCQHYANQGHSAALNCLGLLTETQENNPPLAFYYYNFSAQKGYVPAMINLSKVFEKGFGVSKNLPRAFYWYAQAAQKKNPEAMMHLGRFHFYGLGTKKDQKTGVLWYRAAAKAGNYQAMTRLGEALAKGRGTPADKKEATHWLRKAMMAGSLLASAIYQKDILGEKPLYFGRW